jgi:hypothetical protein
MVCVKATHHCQLGTWVFCVKATHHYQLLAQLGLLQSCRIAF